MFLPIYLCVSRNALSVAGCGVVSSHVAEGNPHHEAVSFSLSFFVCSADETSRRFGVRNFFLKIALHCRLE